MQRTIASALAALCFCGTAAAADYQLKNLSLTHPYARATAPGAKVGAAYLVIENKGGDADKLVSASSPVAGTVELHQMSMEGGIMRMSAVPGVEIKGGGKIELKPGGYHVMLIDLKSPLAAGSKFPLTLTFEKAGKIEVSVDVGDMGGGDMAHKH